MSQKSAVLYKYCLNDYLLVSLSRILLKLKTNNSTKIYMYKLLHLILASEIDFVMENPSWPISDGLISAKSQVLNDGFFVLVTDTNARSQGKWNERRKLSCLLHFVTVSHSTQSIYISVYLQTWTASTELRMLGPISLISRLAKQHVLPSKSK